MIAFKYATFNSEFVYLDGKLVGVIKPCGVAGFAYFPKGSKSHGEIKSSIAEVKKTL